MKESKLLLFGCLTFFVVESSPAAAREPETVRVVDGDPVVRLLPPDAIPAIDDPEFVPADKADRFMLDDEEVLGVVHGGVAKAYSLWHLDRHEIVNDTLKETPVGVTW